MLPARQTTLPTDHTFLRGIPMASSIRTHDQPGATELARARRYAFTGYRWLLLAFLLAGCAQIFLAGLGVFSFGDHDVAGGDQRVRRAPGPGLRAWPGPRSSSSSSPLIARPGVLPVALSGVLVVQT